MTQTDRQTDKHTDTHTHKTNLFEEKLTQFIVMLRFVALALIMNYVITGKILFKGSWSRETPLCVCVCVKERR